MFYLTTHSTHFIYCYMASDIWLRTILIVRKETRCRHIGYSYRLTARVLLYAPSHRQDNTYHGLCCVALAGTRQPRSVGRCKGTTLRGGATIMLTWQTFTTEGRIGNTLFNDALNTFYLRFYGVGHMVKDHSDSERGNPLPLELLFPIISMGTFTGIPRPLLHQS